MPSTLTYYFNSTNLTSTKVKLQPASPPANETLKFVLHPSAWVMKDSHDLLIH